jgi:hypothetical protein
MQSFDDLPADLKKIALTPFEWQPEWNAVQLNNWKVTHTNGIQGLTHPLYQITGLGIVTYTREQVEQARAIYKLERPLKSDEDYEWELLEKRISSVYDKKPKDAVNSPEHYTQGGIECIDGIEASMNFVEFSGYLKGNVMKYLWRYKNKGNAAQDLAKARWYLERLEREVGNSKIES